LQPTNDDPGTVGGDAANAKKSTGPKTGRGKFFTKINGLNGGRPPVPGTRSFLTRSLRRCVELATQLWRPGDAELNLSRLARLRKEMPEGFKILMRRHPIAGSRFLRWQTINAVRCNRGSWFGIRKGRPALGTCSANLDSRNRNWFYGLRKETEIFHGFSELSCGGPAARSIADSGNRRRAKIPKIRGIPGSAGAPAFPRFQDRT